MSFGERPFGLREIKLVSMNGGTVVNLPAPRTMSFSERLKSGELSGGDRTLAVVAFPDALEWSLEAGGISLEAYALMTGRSVTTTGTSPNQTKTLTGSADDVYPYFKIYGKSVGDGADDVHVKIFKAKLTSPLEGQFQDGEFFVTQCSGIAIDDGTNGIFEVVQNETAKNLPSS
ncbi:hypothetical protein [Caldilinea sp.]|uniref:hypothetical protein n=1 Tax=Caldilinea sp. TaxID=2293560 RepID=UPI0021DEA44B|nr:hypothetical protein [Caldilinea sp.]GIV73537.1 MAG: hypothetical protein KatS3mg049_2093 [Caldilinea sp.]